MKNLIILGHMQLEFSPTVRICKCPSLIIVQKNTGPTNIKKGIQQTSRRESNKYIPFILFHGTVLDLFTVFLFCVGCCLSVNLKEWWMNVLHHGAMIAALETNPYCFICQASLQKGICFADLWNRFYLHNFEALLIESLKSSKIEEKRAKKNKSKHKHARNQTKGKEKHNKVSKQQSSWRNEIPNKPEKGRQKLRSNKDTQENHRNSCS